MYKKILFIPLDDRPCTFKMPVDMARIAEVEMIRPHRNKLGKYHRPADVEKILDWLENTTETFDGAIISLDMALYGGLVASRLPTPSLKTISQRLKRLENILKAKKKQLGKIFLSDSVLRTAPTYSDESLIPVIEKIIEYSTERYHLTKGNSSERNLKHIKKEIPDELLERYLNTRERNHQVNLQVIDSLAANVADFLLIGIDDSKTAGLNILEIEKLQEQIDENNLNSKVMIVPGTDESACLLLARMMMEFTEEKITIHPKYTSQKGSKVVPRYEDRSFDKIVKLHSEVIGIDPAHNEEADFIFYVHVPENSQKEAATQKLKLIKGKTIGRVVEEIQQYLKKGKKVSLADCFYANGADRFLMETLLATLNPMKLSGFAGWNTAGNSIGTAMSQGVLSLLADRMAMHTLKEQIKFTIERIADDWLYQAEVRQAATIQAMLRRVSVFHLDTHTDFFKKMIKKDLKDKITDLFENVLRACTVTNSDDRQYVPVIKKGVMIDLPWNRLFEVELDLPLELVEAEVDLIS